MNARAKMFKDDHHHNRKKDDHRASKTKIAVVLAAVAFLIISTPLLVFAQTNEGENKIIETQDTAVANLSEDDEQVNGLSFTPRWGAVSTLAPNDVTVLFADCLEDEMAVSGMYIFEDSEDVVISQSFPVGTLDNVMWVMVVKNTGNENQAVGIGVICAGDAGRSSDTDFDVQTKTTIDNTVKKYIRVEGDTITNINNIIQIRQSIVQNAIQIVKITGNNNTVNQVINQAATQIASVTANGTATPAPTVVQQAIDQSAQQAGIIPQGGGSLLTQSIEQDAAQSANVTSGGFGGTINQGIEQDAQQDAAIRGGNTTTSPAIVDQLIDQNAEQDAEIEAQEATIEQLIEQEAGQQAEVEQGADEAGGPDDGAPPAEVTQEIEQDADQEAEVTESEEEEETPQPAT